ncbi:MAG: class I SAM-dependent methyltransferase [Leptospiraceae bacterium]|nr:class I SAM-dependent methyltransferase [Leptospiraceae bacterium]MCK6381000.1 class I SAM-dependent methyltransferase [Leptospiraceae bacterium]NUM40247.1 class I SAM-dependent methyltransferase [Leptospiraceae bacterium]
MRYLQTHSIFYVLVLISFSFNCKGKYKADFFNRHASDKESMPNEVIQNLKILQGESIADIGSGGGYFAFRFSKEVGANGKVYAVDTDEKLLSYIKNEAEKEKLSNIEFVLAKENDPNLKEKSINLIFIRNVYHHLPSPEKYFCNLKKALMKNGRIAVIDYRKTNFYSFTTLFNHYTDPDKIKDNLVKCGLKRVEFFEFLPKQSFQIFKATEEKE